MDLALIRGYEIGGRQIVAPAGPRQIAGYGRGGSFQWDVHAESQFRNLARNARSDIGEGPRLAHGIHRRVRSERRQRGLDRVHSHDQSEGRGNGLTGNGALVRKDLHEGGAEGVIADHSAAVAPIEPAAIGDPGVELVRYHGFLGLQLAEFELSYAVAGVV